MELLTTRDIANITKLSVRHIAERLTTSKEFPKPYKIGASRRWDKAEFLEWLKTTQES